MLPRIHVRPSREGLLVRDPVSKQPLPIEGAEVEQTPFWVRRIHDGDVVVVETKTESPDAQRAGGGE